MRRREIEIGMYWEVRKVYWEVRMIYIVEQISSARTTYISERREYSLTLPTQL
jgi:hypothetical protein